MTNQSETWGQPRKSGLGRHTKQEAQRFRWPGPKFIKQRLPRSSYPYPSTRAVPTLPAPPIGNSGHVIVNTEEPMRLQTIRRRRHSSEMLGTTGEISDPGGIVHPYNNSALASIMEPPPPQLRSMSGDHRNFPEFEFQTEFITPAQIRHWMSDEIFLVLIELPDISPGGEELRIIHELGALWDRPHQYLDNSCIQQALLELSWLHDEKQRLIERLNNRPVELRVLDEIGCLDIDRLSITGLHGYEQPARQPLMTHPGAYHLDENQSIGGKRPLEGKKSSRAKSQLDCYNKRWEEIQAQSAEVSSALSPSASPAIPWPRASTIHRSQFQAGPNAGNATLETLSWKWSTHAFFVEAFGLRPIVETDENNETMFSFASDLERWRSVEGLKGLRRQMKLEKVRWHEDKMKAIFGPAAATQERVKAVWSAVINLRDQIEQELEALQD